jgi:hypothetical protein
MLRFEMTGCTPFTDYSIFRNKHTSIYRLMQTLKQEPRIPAVVCENMAYVNN